MGAARGRWLDEGFRILAAEGASGVRIDRIAARLGLSKGSFHHHFAGAEGYKRDLLAHYETFSIRALESAIASVGANASAREVLGALTGLIRAGDAELYRPELDVAVRAWAVSDAEVRTVQERVDAARLAALRRVWDRVTDDPERARLSALLPYVLAVGAGFVVPPVSPEDLRGLYEILLPLVPDTD